VVWLDLDVKYTSACELYLDGHFTESMIRDSEDPEPIIIEDGLVSEESSAPFVFSLLAVTGEKKAHLLPAYLELIMDSDATR
jgi:hypothetical protein